MKLNEIGISLEGVKIIFIPEDEFERQLMKRVTADMIQVTGFNLQIQLRPDSNVSGDNLNSVIIATPMEETAVEKPEPREPEKRGRYQIDNEELLQDANDLVDEVSSMTDLYNILAEKHQCPAMTIRDRLRKKGFDHGGRFQRGRRRDQS